MTLTHICNMLGNIVKWIAVIVCSIIVGWTTSVWWSDISPYVLSWEIGMSDVLSIVVDIILACVIAQFIEKSISNKRVEKDYFINELDVMNEVVSDLERRCSNETTLSLHNITYELSRSRKILQRMWKMMSEVNQSYHHSHKADYDNLLKTLKDIDRKLTDTNTFSARDGFEPIKIKRNVIYLNSTVKPSIDADMTKVKEQILRMKISINRI